MTLNYICFIQSVLKRSTDFECIAFPRLQNSRFFSKIVNSRWFTGLCTGWLQTIYFLNMKKEKALTTLGTPRTNSMFHYRALTITKIALPIAAQSSNVRQAEASLEQFKG